jgi:MraZ protein
VNAIMLRGMHKASVDDKGRLKIPTAFKSLLEAQYGHDFYVTSLDGQYARIYPFAEWRKIEEKLAALPSLHPAKRKFLDRANYWGQMADMDAQGRILMPPQLRTSAAMKGEVAVIGYLDYLEVWCPERFDEHLKQNPITPEDEKALSELNI